MQGTARMKAGDCEDGGRPDETPDEWARSGAKSGGALDATPSPLA